VHEFATPEYADAAPDTVELLEYENVPELAAEVDEYRVTDPMTQDSPAYAVVGAHQVKLVAVKKPVMQNP